MIPVLLIYVDDTVVLTIDEHGEAFEGFMISHRSTFGEMRLARLHSNATVTIRAGHNKHLVSDVTFHFGGESRALEPKRRRLIRCHGQEYRFVIFFISANKKTAAVFIAKT